MMESRHESVPTPESSVGTVMLPSLLHDALGAAPLLLDVGVPENGSAWVFDVPHESVERLKAVAFVGLLVAVP